MRNNYYKNKAKEVEESDWFKKCCEAVDVKATRRQASKFINGRGLAFTKGREIVKLKDKQEKFTNDNKSKH